MLVVGVPYFDRKKQQQQNNKAKAIDIGKCIHTLAHRTQSKRKRKEKRNEEKNNNQPDALIFNAELFNVCFLFNLKSYIHSLTHTHTANPF